MPKFKVLYRNTEKDKNRTEEIIVSFPNKKDQKKKFVFNKGSYKSQCAFMLMLIKQKDMKAWLKFKQEFSSVDDEDSYDFYEKLVRFYKGEKIQDNNLLKITKSKQAPAKASPVKGESIEKVKQKEEKLEAKEDKKTTKKAAKKVAKKAAKKKVAKKVAKKAAKKKVAKKVAKKAAKKKVAKKVAKKKVAKKVAKKKVAKKVAKKKVAKKKRA